jgi:hypothetical protein
MITIFSDFSKFSAIPLKKMRFFLIDNQCYNHFLHKLPVFLVKNANSFAKFFGENISKMPTSVPEPQSEIAELPPPQRSIGAGGAQRRLAGRRQPAPQRRPPPAGQPDAAEGAHHRAQADQRHAEGAVRADRDLWRMHHVSFVSA